MNCPNNKYESFPVSAFFLGKTEYKQYDTYLESFFQNRTKHGAKFSSKNYKQERRIIFK